MGDDIDEVVAQLDGIDVLEDLSGPIVINEPVEQPAGGVGGVLLAVADEDATGGPCIRLRHRLPRQFGNGRTNGR
jgi:hypothetical protein